MTEVLSMKSLPYELNLAIEGLNNQQRQEILFALQEVDRLSFSELSKGVGIDRSLLANHLKVLLKTLLVEHYFDQKVGNEAFSYYAISPLGKAILNRLLGTLYSKIEKTRTVTYCIKVEEKETTTFIDSNTKSVISSTQQMVEETKVEV